MAPQQEVEGWSEYRRLVIDALEELRREGRETRNEVALLRGEVIALKVKTALWSGLAATVGSALAWLLTRK